MRSLRYQNKSMGSRRFNRKTTIHDHMKDHCNYNYRAVVE